MSYDAVIIGSGFGGAMVAYQLVHAGYRVLMLERGGWVDRGPHNWRPEGTVEMTPRYSYESPHRVVRGGHSKVMGAIWAVGGPSVFYGAVSLRFRERDFQVDDRIVADSGARWPYTYADLRPYYARAERILDVAGEAGIDPTEPPREVDYPARLNGLSPVSRQIRDAARELGFQPFRLPLAINYGKNGERATCIACSTCDTFACSIEAKNDLAAHVLPDLIEGGLEIRHSTVVTRLVDRAGRIVAVECQDVQNGRRFREAGRLFVLSAGAMGSAHLLLSSDLPRLNPGGHTVGRYLMRHCSAITFGYFPSLPDGEIDFHKQLGIHDLYFGHRDVRKPEGKLGSIQQVQTPPVGLVRAVLPWPLGRLLRPAVERAPGLLAMAEDQPQYRNHVTVDYSRRDRFGLPQLIVNFRHSRRDRRARRILLRHAKRILRRAGALFCYVHRIRTFSHAVGSVRMGDDPKTSALDPYCRFRGVENLFVVDGSFMPTSAGLNPSLTIAANALRAGEEVVRVLAEDG